MVSHPFDSSGFLFMTDDENKCLPQTQTAKPSSRAHISIYVAAIGPLYRARNLGELGGSVHCAFAVCAGGYRRAQSFRHGFPSWLIRKSVLESAAATAHRDDCRIARPNWRLLSTSPRHLCDPRVRSGEPEARTAGVRDRRPLIPTQVEQAVSQLKAALARSALPPGRGNDSLKRFLLSARS